MTRALRLSLVLDEAEYERVADRVLVELSLSNPSRAILGILGPCPFRFVVRFASLNGRDWHRILRFSYELAGGRYECECYYCKGG